MQLLHGKVLAPTVPDGTQGLVTLRDWLSHGSSLESVSLGMEPLSVADPGAFLAARSEAVVIADASTQEQLDVLARAGLDAGYRLFAGAVDLAKSLARLSRSQRSLPTLIVVGSSEQRTRVQVRHLLDVRSVTVVEAGPVASPTVDGAGDGSSAVVLVRRALERGEDVLLMTDDWLDVDAAGPDHEQVGPSATRARSQIESLKQVVGSVLAHPPPALGGIVVTGGDTAHAIVREVLGATRFTIVGEVFAAGVALVPHDGSAPDMPIVSKSGSWGPDDALVRTLDYLVGMGGR
jgi:uncharacterized protein YgbK (DUF1537 family)